MSEETQEMQDIIKEFHDYRKVHPGSMSTNAMRVWLENGRQDCEDYVRKIYTKWKRKRKHVGPDLRGKIMPKKMKEEDNSGGSNVVHNHYY